VTIFTKKEAETHQINHSVIN